MKRHLPPEMCDTPDDYYSQFKQNPEEDYEPEEDWREPEDADCKYWQSNRNWLWQERITPEELQAEIEYIQHNPLPF